MELIESWLKGSRNFSYGRILYNRFGADEALKKLFAAGETKDSKAKLIEVMEALLKIPQDSPKDDKVAILSSTDISLKIPKHADAVEQALNEEWKERYTNMNLMRGQLDAYGTSNSPKAIATCHKICINILEEEKCINAIWEKLDYYRVHKRLPELVEETFVIPDDPVALGRFIQSTERNIRRNKQKARNQPGKALYPALVMKYESLLKQIHDKKAN